MFQLLQVDLASFAQFACHLVDFDFDSCDFTPPRFAESLSSWAHLQRCLIFDGGALELPDGVFDCSGLSK